jgi:hypothetical protein
MVVQRLRFRFSECYNEREMETLLEVVTERGAKYQADDGPNYHLDIPKGFDFLPFYQTLNECESVAWVADQAYPVIVLNTSGIEG